MIRILIVLLFVSMSVAASATNTSYAENNEEITSLSNDDPAERMIRFLSRRIVLTASQKEKIRELAPKFNLTEPGTQSFRQLVRQFKQTVRYTILTPDQIAQW